MTGTYILLGVGIFAAFLSVFFPAIEMFFDEWRYRRRNKA